MIHLNSSITYPNAPNVKSLDCIDNIQNYVNPIFFDNTGVMIGIVDIVVKK